MSVRRVLILSIATLAAGAAGYGLLGLRAPKQLPVAAAAPAPTGAGETIIAVGPDGRLYAIQAPATSSYARSYRTRENRDRYGEGYEHE